MNIFNAIFQILVTLSTIAVPFGIIAGIILAVLMFNEQDQVKKKRLKWWMINCLVVPIVCLLVALSIWGLVQILSGNVGPSPR
jgi:ABC-type methionine transport system permease subunit